MCRWGATTAATPLRWRNSDARGSHHAGRVPVSRVVHLNGGAPFIAMTCRITRCTRQAWCSEHLFLVGSLLTPLEVALFRWSPTDTTLEPLDALVEVLKLFG